MSRKIAMATLVGALAFPVYASAQDSGRYSMETTEEGFLRMDRETGEVSICRERGEDIVCRMAADERRAFEQELDALSDRVTALESRLEGRETETLPDEDEIDRTLNVMERFMRRFFGIVQDLNRELGGAEEESDTRT